MSEDTKTPKPTGWVLRDYSFEEVCEGVEEAEAPLRAAYWAAEKAAGRAPHYNPVEIVENK